MSTFTWQDIPVSRDLRTELNTRMRGLSHMLGGGTISAAGITASSLSFGGASVTNVLRASMSHSYGSLPAHTSDITQNVTVTGAAIGDHVVVTVTGSASALTYGVVRGAVTSSNNVLITLTNTSNASQNYNSTNVVILVIKAS